MKMGAVLEVVERARNLIRKVYSPVSALRWLKETLSAASEWIPAPSWSSRVDSTVQEARIRRNHQGCYLKITEFPQ